MLKETLETFINKANQIHENKYDYTNALWNGVGTKLKIICLNHGEFEQTPSNHLMGKGCAYCSGVGRLTKEILLERLNKVHGDKYEYILDGKITNTTKIKIKCKTHGIFEQTPKNHLKGQICPKCSKGYKYCQEDFIEKCKSIHCDRFDYSKVDYKTNAINIIIVCKVHGDFEQMPLNHLKGDGCYRCSGFTRTTDDFIKKASQIHNNLYDYSKADYKNARENVIIICKFHGEFLQKPCDHLCGCGCSKCDIRTYSKVSLRWLGKIEKSLGYQIQHAGNNGEKKIRINNKIIKFDGYDEKTNTVYEFNGTIFHGDPRVLNSNDINPINKKTYGELYNKTLEREKLIKDAGYNLITMWEKDFK